MMEILTKAKEWLSNTFDEKTRAEVQSLIDNNAEDLSDRFYKHTEVGCGVLWEQEPTELINIH